MLINRMSFWTKQQWCAKADADSAAGGGQDKGGLHSEQGPQWANFMHLAYRVFIIKTTVIVWKLFLCFL